MQKIENILVPFDYHDHSISAINYAMDYAEKIDATITLFYVVEHPTVETLNEYGVMDHPGMEKQELIQKLIANVEERMLRFQQDYIHHCDVKVHIKVGHAYQELTRLIESNRVDLIVIGSHKEENANLGFIQPHTAKIINHSAVPVIVLSKKVEFGDCNQILFVTDFRELNQNFLSKILELQDLTNARLTFLKVNTPTYFKATDEDREEFKKFTEEYDIKNARFRIFNDYEIDEAIIKTADDIKADIIAIGSHRRFGLKRMILQSTVDGLLKHTELPVWTWRLGLQEQ